MFLSRDRSGSTTHSQRTATAIIAPKKKFPLSLLALTLAIFWVAFIFIALPGMPALVALSPVQGHSQLPPRTVAATIIVTNTNDNGVGSLRDALASANAGDTIQFNLLPNSIITLTSGTLSINKRLTINGSTATNLAVNGNNNYGVFFATAPVTFISFTVMNGNTPNYGAGLYGGSAVTLTAMQFLSNTATGNDSYGGGAFALGAATVIGGQFQNNTSSGDGGGLYANNTLALSGTQFISNTATGNGGGEYSANTAVVTNPTFIGNQANGLAEIFSLAASTAPTLPIGWSSSASGVGVKWVTTDTIVHSPPTSLFAPDPDSIGESILDSPAFTPTVDGGLLSFWIKYDTESSFDGAVLEIKIGAGSFQDILTAGGSFAANGYNGTISPSFSNPLAGRNAWTGNSNDFINVLVNLPATSGQGVQLRWHMGSDNSNSSPGVWLDDVSVRMPLNTGGGGGMFANGLAAFTNGLFQNNATTTGYGGGLFVSNTLTASGTHFTYNIANPGGGGLYAGTDVKLTNVHFLTNTAGGAGGGVLVRTPSSLIGGLFQNNTSLLSGGGGLFTNSSIVLTDTQFISNSAQSGGGADVIDSATLNGGLFQNNTSLSDVGGGLVVLNGTLTLTGTKFLSNTASTNGGGAWAGSQSTSINGLFQNNTGQTGGGLYSGDLLTLTGTQFISNAARFDGGGVLAKQAIIVAGSAFTQNATGGGFSGGGLYAFKAYSVTNTAFVSNTTGNGNGGGVWTLGAGSVNSSLFRANIAGEGGGAYALQRLTLTNTLFISNNALYNGGGAWTLSPTLVSGGGFVLNHTDGQGGGLYARDGIVLSGTQFMTNTATANGGGAFAANSGCSGCVVTVQNAQFISNSTTNQGGGLFTTYPSMLTNTDFIRNTAGYQSGALWAGEGGTLSEIHGGRVWSNTSTTNGGAMFIDSSVFISGTDFLNNSGGGPGGALFTNIGSGTTFMNTRFVNNRTSSGQGGAAFINSISTMTNTDFISNSSASNAGAFWANGASTLINVSVVRNRTTGGAAGGAWINGALSMTNSQFISNTALAGAAGGLWMNGTAFVQNSLFQSNQSALFAGGAFAQSATTVRESQFIGNVSAAAGGGFARGGSGGSLTLINDLFAANRSGSGGMAIDIQSPGSTALIEHTTIASPTLALGAAVSIFSPGSTVLITDTLIASHSIGISNTVGTASENYNLFFNTPISTTGSFSAGSGGNDVLGDPKFFNPSADNYHLQVGSAAIDAGTNVSVTIDIDGQPRPYNGLYDIGYDEYVLYKVYLPLTLKNF